MVDSWATDESALQSHGRSIGDPWAGTIGLILQAHG